MTDEDARWEAREEYAEERHARHWAACAGIAHSGALNGMEFAQIVAQRIVERLIRQSER